MTSSPNPEGTILFSSIENSHPARCVRLTHSPSTHVYYALSKKIEASTAAWLSEFLSLDGLDSLLHSLILLAGRGLTSISDSVLQLDCLGCVRSILNTRVGLQYFLDQPGYTNQLALALDTPNVLPKKCIFELLTAVAVHSQHGHDLVLRAFSHLQKESCQPSRFSIIVTEVELAETPMYKTSLLALINTLLGCSHDLKIRCRLRNELTGADLLTALQKIKREDKDADLAVQIEVFEESKHKDNASWSTSYHFDYENTIDLTAIIDQKLAGGAEKVHFLHILQDLFLLDDTSSDRKTRPRPHVGSPIPVYRPGDGDVTWAQMWETMAKTVHHVAGISGEKETDNFLLKLDSILPDVECKSRKRNDTIVADPSETVKEEDDNVWHPSEDIITCSPDIHGQEQPSRRDSGISMSDSARDGTFQRQGSGRGSFGQGSKLPPVEENQVLSCNLKPSLPVKSVKWTKVPHTQASNDLAVWRQVRAGSWRPIHLDYSALEEEFADKMQLSPDIDDEVELLRGDQSLQISMLMARLESSPEELAGLIIEADEQSLGQQAIKCLVKIMPTDEEIHQLRCFQGPRYDLAPAEQFVLNLAEQPDYRTLLNGLHLKSDCRARVHLLKSSIRLLTTTCKELMHHTGLRDFLRLMLEAGNFLNTNTVYGRATGIKLSTWEEVFQVKGTRPHNNLLDTLVRCSDQHSERALMFLYDFPQLDQASRYSLEEIREEISQLQSRLKSFTAQLAVAHRSVRSTFDGFVQELKEDLHAVQDGSRRLKGLSHQIALYFCEDVLSFNLQTCLKQIVEFFILMRRCRTDGVVSRQRQVTAAERKHSLEEQCASQQMTGMLRRKQGTCMSSSFVSKHNDAVLDQLLAEVHRGNSKRFLGDLLQTPDLEDNPLLVSAIDFVQDSPVYESIDNFSLKNVNTELSRLTYADRADGFIDQQYRREKQMKTASYLSEVQKIRRDATMVVDSPEIFRIKIYPKHNEAVASPPVPSNLKTVKPTAKKTHKRCSSDLDRSTRVEDKWRYYEKHVARQAILNAENEPKYVESSNAVSAMGLERAGHTLRQEDFVTIEQDKEPEENNFVRGKKKRSSFGRLKRLVLGKRESNIQDDKDKRGKRGKDKEIEPQKVKKEQHHRSRRSVHQYNKENLYTEC